MRAVLRNIEFGRDGVGLVFDVDFRILSQASQAAKKQLRITVNELRP